VLTTPILAFTMSDPGVQVAPICVFTMMGSDGGREAELSA
jgi:hypothetical protein